VEGGSSTINIENFELNNIYHLDCIEGMKRLPTSAIDIGIDLTVTSPPYDNLRKYKGYQFNFEAIAQELYRITKQGGIVVWIVGDSTMNGSESGTSFKQALYFKEIGFNLHDTMIYAKENYVPLTHNRYEQQFEYMFIFSKGKPKTFNPIKIPTVTPGTKRNRKRKRDYDSDSMRFREEFTEVKSMKYKPNIWFYKIGKNQSATDNYAHQHPAIFPEDLARDHILSWSNEGDVVFDPFMGSGTTAKMAFLHNRKFLGFEISEDYIRLAKQRIFT
jgi:DNA modification methylase